MKYIDSPEAAEVNAVLQMRDLGFVDAQVSGRGTDGGIDVFSERAVAQVSIGSVLWVVRTCLIVAIGAQNAHVLRQGIRRQHVGLVAARRAWCPVRESMRSVAAET